MEKSEKNTPTPSLEAIESWLSGQWEHFFGIRDSQEHDDFFSLGGHSILAIRLITHVHEKYATELSIADILKYPSRSALARLIQSRIGNATIRVSGSIPQADRSQPLPLSPTQEYLLFESLINEDQPVYNELATLHLDDDVAMEPLQQAFNAFIERHEIFRTAFEWESGELYQKVLKLDPVELLVKDFRGHPVDEREDYAAKYASDWASQLFDLKKPPLIRAFVGLYSERDTRLHVVAHHLTIDAYTLFDILPKELWELYQGFRYNRSTDLPQLRIHYADVAAWRKSQTLDNNMKALAYWKRKLSGYRPLDLPGDIASARGEDASGDRKVFHLDGETTRAVKECASMADTTPFVVLLAAFKVLLFRRTRETDLAIGSVTGGREHPDTHGIAGCFLHFVALRTHLTGQLTFLEFLERVSETVFSAVQHQSVQLLDAREASSPASGPIRQSAYNLMFLMEPPQDALPGDWTVNRLEFHTGSSKLDLTFELDESDGCFFARVEYRKSKYTDSFIDELIKDYKDELGRLILSPDVPLVVQPAATAGLPVSAVSVEVLATYARNPEIRLHDPMVAIAKESPDRIALEFGEERMSYGKLNEYSDNIACLLQENGVGSGSIVAVVARRSVWLPVAFFGVLKSGAAYLPVDPDQPDSRVKYLLEDSKASFALRDGGVELPASMEMCNHEIRKAADHSSAEALIDNAEPSDLAYVLYTSGSTGNPKGAMIEHRSIVNRLQWMVHEYGFNESDVQFQKTPITFDVSLHELFLWSFVGARLAVPPPGAERDPEELIRLIKMHQVTQLHFVPSMLEVFLAYTAAFGKSEALASLKNVHCSGEALPPPTVKAFQEQIGKPLGVGLHNLYGPTEAAVDVTYYDCNDFSDGTSVPIGKAVWNTQLYVLNQQLQPVEAGEDGELYIGGLQVGRGYINHPELTEAAFLPDPFRDEPDARIYKTGDLARWGEDGNLEYLGRNDFQIKVRGVRIEPAEIENAMRELPGISGAVCVARKSANSDVQLVGYFTFADGDGNSAKQSLSEHLRKNLPPQLVPSILVPMDSFPLNASGKLDRKGLPEPVLEGHIPASDLSEQETVLVNAWQSVLQVKGVSPADDFFELGGDSIRAIQVISVVRNQGYQIDLRDVFLKSGLKEMASMMQPVQEGTRDEETASGFDSAGLSEEELEDLYTDFEDNN
ncbi:MAG: amino acid adenylation domain-containing protein [Puniceicoccaceae bacterium]